MRVLWLACLVFIIYNCRTSFKEVCSIIIDDLATIANSDLISGAANISQFINVYQATKGATSSQLNTELIKQNQHIENKLDEQTNMLLEKLLSELKIIEEQNIEIIKLLGGGINDS